MMVLFLLVSDWSITGWSVDNQSIIQLVNAEALSVGRSINQKYWIFSHTIYSFAQLFEILCQMINSHLYL